MLDIEEQRHIYSPVSNNLKIEEINERADFYIKCQATENRFLRRGASKVSSTIAPTLEIVSNTYMDGLFKQRQTVSPRREI